MPIHTVNMQGPHKHETPEQSEGRLQKNRQRLQSLAKPPTPPSGTTWAKTSKDWMWDSWTVWAKMSSTKTAKSRTKLRLKSLTKTSNFIFRDVISKDERAGLNARPLFICTYMYPPPPTTYHRHLTQVTNWLVHYFRGWDGIEPNCQVGIENLFRHKFCEVLIRTMANLDFCHLCYV